MTIQLPIIFGVFGVLLCSPDAVAQQQPTVTIQKSSELVTVPVLVTDRSGRPVHGLSQQDFKIVEEGKINRPIAVFDEFESTSGPLTEAAKTETTFSNFAQDDDKPHRVTIIVLDMVNTPFIGQARVRSELLKFLAGNLHGDNPLALLAIGRDGLKQIHAITTNPNVLLEALKRVTGQQSLANALAANQTDQVNPFNTRSTITNETDELTQFEHEADLISNEFQQRQAIRTTLEALEQVAQAFAGVPGRKTLVWASSGFPFLIQDTRSITGFGTDIVADYERTFRAMNTGNIAVYPIDALGLSNASYLHYEASRQITPRSPNNRLTNRPYYDPQQQSEDTLRAFAAATGGLACLNRNDLATCFKEAQQDSASYYMLAYYLPSEDRKPGWHKLKVTVDKKDIHLRARSGFLVPNPAVIRNADTRRSEIISALASPVDYTNLHLMLTWGQMTPDSAHPDRTLARFELHIPPDSFTIDAQDDHIDVEIGAIALTEMKKEAGEVNKILTVRIKPDQVNQFRRAGMRYGDVISLPKGRFTVRFVVRDNLVGRIGTVTAPLEVK